MTDPVNIDMMLDDDDDYHNYYPSITEQGSIVFEAISAVEYRCLSYEGGSAFWIQEGQGIEYWLENNIEFTKPGFFTVVGITGHSWSNCGSEGDEEYYYEKVRFSTRREILNSI